MNPVNLVNRANAVSRSQATESPSQTLEQEDNMAKNIQTLIINGTHIQFWTQHSNGNFECHKVVQVNHTNELSQFAEHSPSVNQSPAILSCTNFDHSFRQPITQAIS